MLVLAGSILATMKILGVTLIAAALVIPPAIARMLTTSFSRMLWMSAAIGAACGFVGHEPQLPPRRPVGADDRARRGDSVRRRVHRDGPPRAVARHARAAAGAD